MNIKDIQALPDSLQMAIKLLPFEKSDYVLVINPFFENTKKVLSNLKDYYVYWKINHNTDIKSRKTVSFREKPEIMY